MAFSSPMEELQCRVKTANIDAFFDVFTLDVFVEQENKISGFVFMLYPVFVFSVIVFELATAAFFTQYMPRSRHCVAALYLAVDSFDCVWNQVERVTFDKGANFPEGSGV
eukprot:14852260-Ditylum_brightwellii.AAC.1